MQFSDIYGHKKIKERLIHSVNKNRIAHTQLFSGKMGNAQLALAWAYATYINCKDKKETDSCGICSACLKYKQLAHPDFHPIFPTTTLKDKKALSREFYPEWRNFIQENTYGSLEDWIAHLGEENKNYQIAKEESRYISKIISLTAFEGLYKVVLIWLPEFLHLSASNALLKTLEDPPPKTIFLLITIQVDKILPTVLSRTQPVVISEFSEKDIALFLIEKIKISPTIAAEISSLAQGNLHKALELYKKIDMPYKKWFQEWMRNCFKKDFLELYGQTEHFYKSNKENQKIILHYGLSILRGCILAKYSDEKLLRIDPDEFLFVKNFSKILDQHKIEKLAQLMDNSLFFLERSAHPKILFMNLSIESMKVLTSSNIE